MEYQRPILVGCFLCDKESPNNIEAWMNIKDSFPIIVVGMNSIGQKTTIEAFACHKHYCQINIKSGDILENE